MVAVAGLLTVVLALPALRIGFLLDDHFHRMRLAQSGPLEAAMNLFGFIRDQSDVDQLLEVGALPWWSHPGLRIAFWRPLSSLTHWLDDRLWRDCAPAQHAHSLLWAAAVMAAAGLAYRRLLGARATAGLAVILFAIDDAHYIPVAWIANRNALVSMLFGLVTLVLHDRWRKDGSLAAAWLAAVAFALTLLGGESGVCMAAYLFAYALVLDPAPQPARRFLTLTPYAAVGLAWYSAYWSLGFGAWGSGFYVDPAREPLRFVAGALWRWPLLLQAQSGLASADLMPLLARSVQDGLIAFSGVWVALLALLFAPLVRRCAMSRFFLLGAALCLLPNFGTAPSDRLLLPCGFGFFGALALLTSGLARQASWVPRDRLRRLAMLSAVTVLLIVHGPLAARLLPERIGNLTQVNRLMGLEPNRMPSRADLAGRQLICVAPPGCFFLMYVGVATGDLSMPSSPSLLGLTSGSTPVRLTRLDERTLEVEPAGGFLTPLGETGLASVLPPRVSVSYFTQTFDHLFRASSSRMSVGQHVRAGGCEIEVVRLTSDGRPAAVRVEFPCDLSGPRYVWMSFQNSRYVPFAPPRAGETLTVPPATFDLAGFADNLGAGFLIH